MFPNPEDPFWLNLIRTNPQVSSLALRLLLNRLQKDLEAGKVAEADAVAELVAFFNKYKAMCKREMEVIENQL
ncbi:MAG: hypothetical protein AAF616_11110 [Bacteroidota bacterium]